MKLFKIRVIYKRHGRERDHGYSTYLAHTETAEDARQLFLEERNSHDILTLEISEENPAVTCALYDQFTGTVKSAVADANVKRLGEFKS